MTTPTAEVPEEVPEEDSPLIEALIVALLAGYSVSVLKNYLQKLLKPLGLDPKAITAAINLASRVPREYEPLKRDPKNAKSNVRRKLVGYRAAYLLNCAKRISAAIKGAPKEEKRQRYDAAKARENVYYKRHVAMQRRRISAARAVDRASLIYGDTLGWLAFPGERPSEACQKAHMKNFKASEMPSIGFPGAVHMNCKCVAVAPWPNAPLLR